MISAQRIARRLEGLESVGVGRDGVTRLAWTEEDAAARAWFERQADELGRSLRRDPAGNLWACPEREPPWWGVGSHLDSVRAGGRFDGPLGVACGFEIAADGAVPIAVVSFADEEGARFNTPTFGSRALIGRLDVPAVLARRDGDGTPLGEAMLASGVDPEALAQAPEWLPRLSGFIEIHIDQTSDLARARVPAGIVTSLAGRRRLEVELRGRADHAGTTPVTERRDALSAAAHLIVAAEELAEGVDRLTVTTSRIIAEPNAPTTIAARVRLWIDARAPNRAVIDDWARELADEADELGERSGVGVGMALASDSDPVEFPPRVRVELRRAADQLVAADVPEMVCFAGHDAGVLAERIPAGMVLVRNPTGVSHSPDETVDLEDAAVAASIVERAVAQLAAGR